MLCVDKYVIQIALDTASIMTNNWPKGKNWKGTSWKGLAEWNAGQMGGGQSYLTDERYMRESDHKEFLRKAIWSGDFDYSMYPDANVGGGSYAELHQTGGTNAKGVKLPARPWHPDDLGELSDFPANVIKEAYEGAELGKTHIDFMGMS